MPTMSTTVKATKKSAFSCEPCRRRKVKCGGEQPVCNRCASRKDECIYKLNPTLSYTQRLENRIKELEEQVTALSKSPISTHPSSSHSSPPSFNSSLPSLNSHDALPQKRHLEDHSSMTRRFRGLKMDDKGGFTYHAPPIVQFNFNTPSDRNTTGNTFLPLTSEVKSQTRGHLLNNTFHQRSLGDLSEIPEPFQHLLNVHWCWTQPLYNFVYRPAFTRNMQSMGPYYSHTLLNAMLSHSIRWGKNDPSTKRLLDESYEGGAIFGKHARSMIFEELSNGVCNIPTVQTLLLLSAQECGFGNTTQAWTYSGLAFRLIEHLGISADGNRYIGPVPRMDEDDKIRHRLFWSCYFWDKMISLYLGRSPSIRTSPAAPPHVMFDESAENDIWVPFGASGGQTWNYPPTPSHSSSCFMSMCQLSVIFNQILIHMYDPVLQNTEEEVEECLRTQEAALQQWWDQLPPFLCLDPCNLPRLAPPSHIVTMNCLYHTFKILLYRPMLTRGIKPDGEPAPIHSYLVHCVTSATSIIAIFNLFLRTFSTNYCVLSLSYTVYIAATIYLLQVQAFPHDHQALQRLDFCIRGLNEVKKYSPIIGGALNLITRDLAALGITLQSVQQVVHTPLSNTTSESKRSNSFYGTPLSNTSEKPTSNSFFTPLTNDAETPTSSSFFTPLSNESEKPSYFGPQPLRSLPPQHLHNTKEYLFQSEGGDDTFGPDPTLMEPGAFEVMSSLEPLSAWVGTIPDFENQGGPSYAGSAYSPAI